MSEPTRDLWLIMEAKIRDANRLAFLVAEAVMRGEIGERSAIGDCLLNYLNIGGPDGPLDVPAWMDSYRESRLRTEGTPYRP